MFSWFQLVQLMFAGLLVGVVAERIYVLGWRDATDDEAARWLVRMLDERASAAIESWRQARPQSQLGRLLACAVEAGGEGAQDARELLADLSAESRARLRLLRVSATLASTLGLLGGILCLSGQSSAATGLLALKAGGASRLALDEAITTMAIGVASSAFCFQALSLLRPIAEKRLLQARQVARALGLAPGPV